VVAGDSGDEAYTAIVWGVGLSHERSDIAGAERVHHAAWWRGVCVAAWGARAAAGDAACILVAGVGPDCGH